MENYQESKYLTKEQWEKWNDYVKTGKINGKKENNIFAVATHIGTSVAKINSYEIEQRAKKNKMANGGSIKNNNDYMRATDKYDLLGALLDDAREENNTAEITKLREQMEKLETEINRYERNYAKGGKLSFKERSEKDSLKLSKAYKKVLESNFDDKIYNDYQKIVKETKIPKEQLQKIETYISTTPKGNQRMIDIYQYWGNEYADGGGIVKKLKGYRVDIFESKYRSSQNVLNEDSYILVTDGIHGDSSEVNSDEVYLKLVKRNLFGKEIVHAEPVNVKDSGNIMFGGKFIWSSDSRFRNDVSERPVQLHDRVEQYAKGGKLKEVEFENSNLYFYGFGIDSNGNSIVKIGFPNQRAFSIQTNGVLNFTHDKSKYSLSELTKNDIEKIEKEVVEYVKEYGSKEQKSKLKTYSKYADGGGIDSNINKKYLDSIPESKKQSILRNIANHYGISIVDAEKEVTDIESEALYEYITNESLRMEVYNDMKNRKFADGGNIGEIESKIADFRRRAENKSIPESAKNKFLSMAEELEKTLPKAEKKEKITKKEPKEKAVSNDDKEDLIKMAKKMAIEKGLKGEINSELEAVRIIAYVMANESGFKKAIVDDLGNNEYTIEVSPANESNNMAGMIINKFKDGTFEVSEMQAGEGGNFINVFGEYKKLKPALVQLLKGNKQKPVKVIDMRSEGEKKKAEFKKEEPKKPASEQPDCDELEAKWQAARKKRKEREAKREKQGKPAELTPAETTKKAVDKITDKIEAKSEKGKSVKTDITAVFSQFKSAVFELKKYKNEIDEKEVRNLIKELESLLTKKMATGGGVDFDSFNEEIRSLKSRLKSLENINSKQAYEDSKNLRERLSYLEAKKLN